MGAMEGEGSDNKKSGRGPAQDPQMRRWARARLCYYFGNGVNERQFCCREIHTRGGAALDQRLLSSLTQGPHFRFHLLHSSRGDAEVFLQGSLCWRDCENENASGGCSGRGL